MKLDVDCQVFEPLVETKSSRLVYPSELYRGISKELN